MQLQVSCTCYSCEQAKTFRPMPALVVAGVRWHIGSDDVPLFATFGSAFHAIWIVVILLTSQGVLNMPNQCHHDGRQYIATVVGLLFCFTFGFIVEILLIWEGCKGRHAGSLPQSTSFSEYDRYGKAFEHYAASVCKLDRSWCLGQHMSNRCRGSL